MMVSLVACSSKQQFRVRLAFQSNLILIRNAGSKADNQKSCWEPLQIGEWLGIIVNTIQAIFIVPEKKIRKAKAVSNGVLLDFPNVRVLDVARIRRFRDFFHFGHGQCRSDFHETNVFVILCVQMRSSWSDRLSVSSEFLDEVRFWIRHIDAFNHNGYAIRKIVNVFESNLL